MRIAALFAVVMLLATSAVSSVPVPVTAAECDPNYTGACVPMSGIINCEQVKAQVKVVGKDLYGLDADNDGIGCDEFAKSTSNGSNGTAGGANGSGSCTTIFVSGKGVIDSCSNTRAETSRVYPRKPGVPPNGCVDTCPEVSATPAPSSTTQTPPRPDTPPVDVETQYTPPIGVEGSGPRPEAPQNCDRVSYPDVCIPVAPPYLSCSDVPDRNFRVRAPDPHRFDADGNGIGCEEVRGPAIGR